MKTRILLAFACALALPSMGLAGDIYVPAEAFGFSSATNNCTKTRRNGVDYNYDVIQCPDAGSDSVKFLAEVEFPNDSGNTWSCQVEYDIGTAHGICAWTCRFMALTASGDSTAAMNGTTGSVSANHDVLEDLRNRTSTSSAVAVYDQSTAGSCTGTDCRRYRTRVEVALDRTTTTATTCDFVNLNIYY